MTPKRVFITCISTAILLCVGYLLFWWLGWRVFVTQSQATHLILLPLTAACALLLAVAMVLIHFGGAGGSRIRAVAGIAGGLALFVILEHALGLQSGVERYFFGEETLAVFDRPTSGRPAVQTALALMFLSFSVWFGARPRRLSFDLSDVGAMAAMFMSFAALIGYFYEFGEPLATTSTTTLAAAFVLVLLSLAALSLNPHGMIAALDATDAGGAARRRMLPVAVLAPVVLGLLFVYTQEMKLLELSVSLALMVTASIGVFIVLIERVGVLLSHIEEERKDELHARESRAMEVGMTDALTGLLNRRGWDRNLKATEELCQAQGLNSCVIVIDLDGLKRINDTLGHQQGDALIKRAANALKSASRKDDFLARLGGDEFAYLAVGCEPEHAGSVLRRLSLALENGKVQASLGYAMRDLAGSLQAAFQEADHAMYAHKRERKAHAPVGA